ncbi:MAG: K(+)-transporting ATPase subunit C [Sphingobacteriales bacterium]|nr:MAG: K(+)-transporting ATPase subunit C [Sphingobacteriales bacterium]
MKTYLLPSLKLTLILIIITAGLYPLLIAAIGKVTPGNGEGVKSIQNGRVVGYTNVGQKFTDDRYFWSRPSAVDYNAAGSAGSNKGPSNPNYLMLVLSRIDTFTKYNPSIEKSEIPSDMVTASGSGLDPNISVQGAKIQVKRIAKLRNISEEKLVELVLNHTEKPLLNLMGPEKVHLLNLNLALDELTQTNK